jgi:hypothetical protein
MKKQRTMLGVGLLIGSWIIHGPACAQEYRGTAQQQAACTPDVWPPPYYYGDDDY